MLKTPRKNPTLPRAALAALAVVMLATVLVALPATAAAQVQADGVETLEVWGISGGIVNNPKQWKFAQSTTFANDIGSATAAAVNYDDSSWSNVELRWKEFPGMRVANHFRKDFTLEEIGVEMFQIEGIQVGLLYDDAAVLYLNGVEVYRSIRGNLDPTYAQYAPGANVPFYVDVPWGGYEDFYVQIPDPGLVNSCEHNLPCPTSPYGGPQPLEIPKELLNEDGVNTWAVTTWTNTIGGSGDSSIDHVFQLLIDENAVPPNTVFINEVMASNDTVDLEDNLDLGFPDWFELVNTSSNPVNLQGWTISDSGASWVLPSVVIPGNGYLVVVANDGDRNDTNPLQTNFKLSSEGDSLKLTNADGFIADEYTALPKQFADNSFGRPNDTGTAGYLAAPTPGAANSVLGDGYAPILRPFAGRIYNVGESVSNQVNAFDPDGDALSYSLSPMPPGLSIDTDGVITGTANTVGSFITDLTVTDGDGDSDTQQVQWVVVPAVSGPAPIVLNEYNAVADDRELIGGSPVGNGGDWYEFLVVADQLDLRGYQIELYNGKDEDGTVEPAATVTFGNDPLLARAPAGTIVTISELLPNDLSFNGVDDWHINLQIDNGVNGRHFAPTNPLNNTFNSTRTAQTVLIKDANGVVVTPLSGETEAWDNANGGVSGGEVMNLCVNPLVGMTLDPVADYRDNAITSSFGQPNTCVYSDPVDPTITITFNQNTGALQTAATMGANSGDANCDLVVNVTDALLAAQYSVGNRGDSGPCHFDGGGAGFEMYGPGADINRDGSITVTDALIIARCSVGIPLQWCPA